MVGCGSSRARRGRGFAVIYTVIILVVLSGFVSLAVDVGRVQLAKSELQTAADAAVRAAAAGLRVSEDQARTDAVALAGANKCNGTPVALDRNLDVEFGTWDSSRKIFVSGSGGNAVRVRARRIAARGTAIELVFARLIGMNTCDVSASAIATVRLGTAPPTGIVGVDSVSFVGDAMTDSYDSSKGRYSPGAAQDHGNVSCNSNISLAGKGMVRGDASPGPGRKVTGPGVVTGSCDPLTAPITFPEATAGDYASKNDNLRIAAYLNGSDFEIAGGTHTIPAGTYYVGDFTLRGDAKLNISGPVTFYITGTLRIDDNAMTMGNRPDDFHLTVVSTSPVSVQGGGPLEAVIYAPSSNVRLAQGAQLMGSVVGKTLMVQNDVQIHYDQSLTAGSGSAGQCSISLVN